MKDNIVYCFNSKHELKDIKTFKTLEECFNFISEQNRKYTKETKLKDCNLQNQQLELELF